MRYLFLSFLTIMTVVGFSLADLLHSSRTEFPLNPDLAVLGNVDRDLYARSPAPVPAPVPQPMTNAKRFQLGLPPAPPVRRGANAAPAKRSAVPPVWCFGYIRVNDNDNQTWLGYLSNVYNAYGEYGYIVPEVTHANALKVSFSYPASDTHITEPFTLSAYNPTDKKVPFIGGIVGYTSTSNDLEVGSPNYNYIGGVAQSNPGPASGAHSSYKDYTGTEQDTEAVIWQYDLTTSALLPRWVNSDSSVIDASLIYTSENGEPFFAMTGDAAAFKKTYMTGTSVNFTFVLSP